MELNPNHSIGHGFIIHKRTRDTQNFFQYNAPYLSLNLNDSAHYLGLFLLINLIVYQFFIDNMAIAKNKILFCSLQPI